MTRTLIEVKVITDKQKPQRRNEVLTVPKLEPVDSSNIVAMAHSEKDEVLFVKFKNSSIYAYTSVPPGVYSELRKAPSKGIFFNKEIKPYYDCCIL